MTSVSLSNRLVGRQEENPSCFARTRTILLNFPTGDCQGAFAQCGARPLHLQFTRADFSIGPLPARGIGHMDDASVTSPRSRAVGGF